MNDIFPASLSPPLAASIQPLAENVTCLFVWSEGCSPQGDFTFLRDQQTRQSFYERINRIMEDEDYTLIASAIHKQQHKARYGMQAENPYDLALTFCLERLVSLLEGIGQQKCQIVAEARGEKENNELRLSFLNTVTDGTLHVPVQRFRQIDFHLTFLKKNMNIVGTQLADLAAYPIARHVLNKDRLNLAYNSIEAKFYKEYSAGNGLMVFP